MTTIDLSSADGRTWLDGTPAAAAAGTAPTTEQLTDAIAEAFMLDGPPITVMASVEDARSCIEAAFCSAERTRCVTVTADEDIHTALADPATIAACFAEPLERQRWQELRAAADDGGFALISDERRSAGRLSRSLAFRDFGAAADAVLLGDALTNGAEPLGVIVGLPAAITEGRPAPTPAAATAAVQTLKRLAVGDLPARCAAIGDSIRAVFDSACARENIHAQLVGPPALMRFKFAGQENAEAPLMAHHFGLELERVGALPGKGEVIASLAMEGDGLHAVTSRIDQAVARMRCLLIEHNSYLCGEVPFVFPDADPRVADRGIALYRFPKLGPVELTPEGDAMRIHFLGGELGEVTSSGFYLPTLFSGDFDIRCDYRVDRWEPGPDSACLALFAQNTASSARYYAQRMSHGADPDNHSVLGSLTHVLHEARPVATPTGQFRLQRRGASLSAFHRSDPSTDWDHLATDDSATTDDVLFGAKIWSKVESGHIDARISNLVIDGTFAEEQIPRLEHRPDPRKGGG